MEGARNGTEDDSPFAHYPWLLDYDGRFEGKTLFAGVQHHDMAAIPSGECLYVGQMPN
jgi:hypothetical protein